MEGGTDDGGRDGGWREGQTDRVCVLPVSVPGANTGLAEGRSQEGSAKGRRVTAPLPSPHPTSLRGGWPGWAQPLWKAGPGAATHPSPGSRRLRAPCGLAAGGEPLCAGRRSQEKQAARHPGRPSAAKCCISHKGGSQRALLREIRDTGNAEPSFNTRLIFMELRQRQPPCRERSRSTEGEQQFPHKQLLAGRRVHLAHKTTRSQAEGGVLGPAGAGVRASAPAPSSSGVALSKSPALLGYQCLLCASGRESKGTSRGEWNGLISAFTSSARITWALRADAAPGAEKRAEKKQTDHCPQGTGEGAGEGQRRKYR